MKRSGPKHTFAEKRLMEQVAEVFTKKKKDLGGARQVADALNISLASFYNYAAGTDLPRIEVLERAHKKWRVKWRYFDESQFLRVAKLQSPEQYTLPFLDAVEAKDVKVDRIKREGKNVLRVALKIRFSA